MSNSGSAPDLKKLLTGTDSRRQFLDLGRPGFWKSSDERLR